MGLEVHNQYSQYEAYKTFQPNWRNNESINGKPFLGLTASPVVPEAAKKINLLTTSNEQLEQILSGGETSVSSIQGRSNVGGLGRVESTFTNPLGVDSNGLNWTLELTPEQRDGIKGSNLYTMG